MNNQHTQLKLIVLGPQYVRQPRLAYTIREVVDLAGLSLPHFRELAKRGDLPLRYVNSKAIVVAEELLQWVADRASNTHNDTEDSVLLAAITGTCACGHTKYGSASMLINAIGRAERVVEPIAYNLTDAAAVVGIGKTLLREQIRGQYLEVRYANSKPIVPIRALKDWLVSLPSSLDKVRF